MIKFVKINKNAILLLFLMRSGQKISGKIWFNEKSTKNEKSADLEDAKDTKGSESKHVMSWRHKLKVNLNNVLQTFIPCFVMLKGKLQPNKVNKSNDRNLQIRPIQRAQKMIISCSTSCNQPVESLNHENRNR